ncbi:hypothetical protein PDN32_19125, partial [Bacillus cereus]|nr:hypothetical protein [Bacillus cereus]MDA2335272.1 hypothetical protein [Bacillus cereus]
RQGLFDMPTFMISIKDNKKLHGKISLCINIYFKLMDVGYRHIPINLKILNHQQNKNELFVTS